MKKRKRLCVILDAKGQKVYEKHQEKGGREVIEKH